MTVAANHEKKMVATAANSEQNCCTLLFYLYGGTLRLLTLLRASPRDLSVLFGCHYQLQTDFAAPNFSPFLSPIISPYSPILAAAKALGGRWTSSGPADFKIVPNPGSLAMGI